MEGVTLQEQVREAGRQAEARARKQPPPHDDPATAAAINKALDPESDFPEPRLDSAEQQEAMAAQRGHAGPGTGTQAGDDMALRPPVAGKHGQKDLPGDAVAGVNRGVGTFLSEVGDTEAGRKGAGGVDFSNSTV